MNLALIDLRLPMACPAPGAAVAPAPEVVGWHLHLERASADAEALDRMAGGRDKADLESCGFPLGPGALQVVRAVPQPPPPAAPEEPSPPRTGSEREAQRVPLRVHVQSTPAEGLRVWLGIDGNAALVAQCAGAAVASLRRAPPAGARIASVVCNGVPVYPHAPWNRPS